MEELAVDNEGDDRRVIVLFHNLKGYDGMFLLQYLYRVHREVMDQITVGTKILCFTSDRLTFKDSLCFLPFPLSAFPATFGLTELRKGFFPNLFKTLENQDYEGPMPDARFYDPDGMSAKKKANSSGGTPSRCAMTSRSISSGTWPRIPSRTSNYSKRVSNNSNRSSRLRRSSPLCKVHHHRRRLQPFLAEKTLTRPHHRVRALSSEEGSSVESVRQSAAMDGVARASSSHRHAFHVVRPSKGPHPTRAQRRRATPSRQVPRGRVRRHHPYRLRVSRTGVCGTGAPGVSPSSATSIPKCTPIVPCKKCTSPPRKNISRCGKAGTNSASSGSATGT